MASDVNTSNRVSLSVVERQGTMFLQFDFTGHLDVKSAQAAIAAWKGKLQSGKKADLIYNCLEMTGFETEARRHWQNAMSDLKSSTGNIWIISTNPFILAAAKTMGVLTRFEIKVATSLDRVKG